jgi:ribosome-binding factor A
MTPFSRADRVGGLIQEILSEILKKDIRDPRLEMTTITKVRMSSDLKLARIYFAVYGDSMRSKAAAEGFISAHGFIKRSLAHQLGLRYMPDLKFFYDDSMDYASHIDRLLKTISKDDGTSSG